MSKCHCCLDDYDTSSNNIYICSIKNKCEYQICKKCIKNIMIISGDKRCPACRETNTLFEDIVINMEDYSDSEYDMPMEQIDAELDRLDERLNCCVLKIINCFITINLFITYSPYCFCLRCGCQSIGEFHDSLLFCFCLDKIPNYTLRNFLGILVDLIMCVGMILVGRLFSCLFWWRLENYWEPNIGIFLLSSFLALVLLFFFFLVAFFLFFVFCNLVACICDFFCPLPSNWEETHTV